MLACCSLIAGHASLTVTGSCGSKVPVRIQPEQSLAGHRDQMVDLPVRPAAAEEEVPRFSGQPPDEPAKVRYRCPPSFARESSHAAPRLEQPPNTGVAPAVNKTAVLVHRSVPRLAYSLGRAVPSVQALTPEIFPRGVAENAATRARFRLSPLLLMILAMVS